jgi:hypothetical protein
MRDEAIERFRERRAQVEAEPLRQQLAGWASTNIAELREAEPELPDELDDRGQDVLEPLLAIAEALGFAPQARKALVELRGSALHDQNEDIGIRLLADVRKAFTDAGKDRLATKELLELLAGYDESAWATWHRGNVISAKALAELLHEHQIRSRTIRMSDGTTPKGYRVEQFEDAWKRLLPDTIRRGAPSNATTPQPAPLSQKQAISSRHTKSAVATENSESPWRKATCGGAAANGAGDGPKGSSGVYTRVRWDDARRDFVPVKDGEAA